MTDDELIAWVADNIVEPSGIGGLCRSRDTWYTGDGDEWEPLDDRNDNQMVIDAMAKTCNIDLFRRDDVFTVCIGDGEVSSRYNAHDEMRAVLEAAKMAWEASK